MVHFLYHLIWTLTLCEVVKIDTIIFIFLEKYLYLRKSDRYILSLLVLKCAGGQSQPLLGSKMP